MPLDKVWPTDDISRELDHRVCNTQPVLASFFSISVGSAVTLDWSTVTWTAGSTSQSYDIDPTNPGTDITISMTSSLGNQFASGFPAIATGFGGSTTTPDLRERIQLTTASQFVTTTINFNYTQGLMCKT